ncbi:MAG: hypothetical protein ABIC40_00620, partial [bacterium]
MKRKVFILLGIIIVIAGLVAAAIPNWQRAKRKAMRAEVRSNIHTIQVALCRYGVDHDDSDHFCCEGIFPDEISSLIEEGYIIDFPVNPFTREPMKNIELGSEPQAGEFTYVPIYGNGAARGFLLYAYDDEEEWK